MYEFLEVLLDSALTHLGLHGGVVGGTFNCCVVISLYRLYHVLDDETLK